MKAIIVLRLWEVGVVIGLLGIALESITNMALTNGAPWRAEAN